MRKVSSVTDDEVGGLAYETYCKAVGGKAFNGDPLPAWAVMCKDEKKQNLVTAWKRAARAVAALVERERSWRDQAPASPSLPAANPVATSMPAPTRTLAVRTKCCGSMALALTTGHYTCPCGDHQEAI